MKDKIRGYTLVELLVVVFLISILLAVSLYCIDGVMEGMRVKNCVRSICNAMRYAAYKARLKGRIVRVRLNGSFLIIENKKNGRWKEVKKVVLSEKANLSSRGKPVFYPEGVVVPAGSFTVISRDNSHFYKITVSCAGRIKIRKKIS